jgi:hypothetical protein
MKKSTLGAFPFLKPSTKANPQLHTAVLMNPDEVDAASENHPVEARHKLHGRWMLVGAVNEEMYLAFKAHAGNDIAGQLMVLPTPAGAAYGIVSCQIGAHQHRFILPLFDIKVIKFLASTANESLNVYLESTGELGEGMLYDCSLAPDQIALARTMSKTIACCQLEQFTKELPSVISEMLSLDLMPSLNAEIVLAVDVSVLLPRLRDERNSVSV